VFVTRGIADKDELQQKEILDRVRAFDLFTSENDPYAEHDFGSFEQGRDNLHVRILRTSLVQILIDSSGKPDSRPGYWG
jgi:Protein of unknown function (DUF3768)